MIGPPGVLPFPGGPVDFTSPPIPSARPGEDHAERHEYREDDEHDRGHGVAARDGGFEGGP